MARSTPPGSEKQAASSAAIPAAAHWMEPLEHFGCPRRGQRLRPGTDECPVKRLVECRDLFHPLKSFLRVIRFQVFHLTGFVADAEGRLMAVRVTRRVVDLHFIEARGQRLNLSQALQDRPVL